MTPSANPTADLIVIGSGFAGTAATCFALARGLKTIQVSATGGEMAFASGLIDLLGIHPLADQRVRDDPWAGIEALRADSPRHPYAHLGAETIRRAIQEFLTLLESFGLSYRGLPDRNVTLATAAGTTKTTYRVPKSMWHGVTGLSDNLPTLLVDFVGMKDFSVRLMAEMLKSRWPALRSLRAPFPRSFPGPEIHNLLLAEAFEDASVREQLVSVLRPHLAEARLLGMPAVLGLRSSAQVIGDLEDRLGVNIFEIPTLPPSIPALRLRDALEAGLQTQGAHLLHGQTVIAACTEGSRCTGVITGTADWHETLEADGVILATGRFLGGGLVADRDRIREPIFGLPVAQPPTRHAWHRDQFLDRRGHPVNEAGVEIDDGFRPLRSDSRPAFDNLFAAGSILAHHDWMRAKSGAGLAIATAYGAVESFRHRTRMNTG
ncbi:MAG: glycerol-3-phosphate dehydrogenase subunit GlpB [Syntrophobacteraceae bacterium]